MKFKKETLITIIKEELNQYLRESDDIRSFAEAESQSLDDGTYILDSVASGVFDALEESGMPSEAAESAIANIGSEELMTAVERGLADYLRKLGMKGGIPKPRQL